MAIEIEESVFYLFIYRKVYQCPILTSMSLWLIYLLHMFLTKKKKKRGFHSNLLHMFYIIFHWCWMLQCRRKLRLLFAQVSKIFMQQNLMEKDSARGLECRRKLRLLFAFYSCDCIFLIFVGKIMCNCQLSIYVMLFEIH